MQQVQTMQQVVPSIQVVTGYSAGRRTDYLVGTQYLAVKTCEKMCLNNRPLAWQDLRNMREARSSFNPCMFFGVIYLCGHPSLIMEAFSVQDEQFIEPFDVRLPTDRPCFLFADGGALVVHSTAWVLTFRKGQGNQLVADPIVNKNPAWEPYENTQPVLDKARNLVYLSYSNQCFFINPTGGQQMRAALS